MSIVLSFCWKEVTVELNKLDMSRMLEKQENCLLIKFKEKQKQRKSWLIELVIIMYHPWLWCVTFNSRQGLEKLSFGIWFWTCQVQVFLCFIHLKNSLFSQSAQNMCWPLSSFPKALWWGRCSPSKSQALKSKHPNIKAAVTAKGTIVDLDWWLQSFFTIFILC